MEIDRSQTLTVGDKIESPDGKYYFLAVNSEDSKVRNDWRNKSIAEVKTLFTNKEIQVSSGNDKDVFKVLDVEVTSSVAEFKLIFLKIERNSVSEMIIESSEVKIML